jgi:hypothetical protein
LLAALADRIYDLAPQQNAFPLGSETGDQSSQVQRPDKQERRVAAMQSEMQRVLKRLMSLSAAMMRADAAWEAYHREMIAAGTLKRSLDEWAELNTLQTRRVENNEMTRAVAHMDIWLAMLYVVVEGWRKWKFFDPTVDRLLESQFVDDLKAYRHAMFHANDFDDPRALPEQLDAERMRWHGDLGNALRAGLRDWHANLPSRIDEYLLRSPL